MIRIIIETTTRKRDAAGYCEHMARIFTPERGRNTWLCFYTDGPSNALHTVVKATGLAYEEILQFDKVVSARDYKELARIYKAEYVQEYAQLNAIADLVSVRMG